MKVFHYFLSALLTFSLSISTAFASAPDVDNHENMEYACYLMFKSFLTRHDSQYFEGSFWSGASSNRILKENYWLSNDSGSSVGQRYYLSSDDIFVIKVLCSGTYPNSPGVRVSSDHNKVSIDSSYTSISSSAFECVYTVKVGSNAEDPYFNINVSGSTWVYPLSLDSSTNDLDTIISLLTTTNSTLSTISSRINTTNSRLNTTNTTLSSINSGIGVTNEHLLSVNNHFVTLHNEMALVNFQLLDISDKLSYNSNSNINENVSTTNNSLSSGIDSLESIESSNMSNLNSNLINVSTSSTTNWIFSSSPLLAATSFISEQLTNIYNANTNLKSFTNTILVIGFAFLMLGVAL